MGGAFFIALVVLSATLAQPSDETPVASSSPTDEPPPPAACGAARPPEANPPTFEKPDDVLRRGVDYSAVIETSCGAITIDLLEESAPVTVNNFVFLAREGFFDGLRFHRVERNAVIQGGAPNPDGSGDPGYTIREEYPDSPAVYTFGTVAMVNEGPETTGSEFFIVVHDPPQVDPDPEEKGFEPAGFRPDYPVFGKVDLKDESSLQTLKRIYTQETQVGNDPAVATRPLVPVYIESVEIAEAKE